MKQLLIIKILFLTLAFNSISQNHSVEFMQEQKTKSRGATFIGMDENGYAYARSYRTFYAVMTYITHSYIKVYDSRNGNVITEKRIDSDKELSRMGYTLLRFMLNDDKPVFLLKKKGKSKGDSDYYLVDVNEKLNTIGSPYKVGYSADCKSFIKTTSDLYFFEDKETSLNLTFTDKSCRTDDEISLYGILRDKNNELINDFSFILEVPKINQLTATIYDKDKYYISVLSIDRKKKAGKLFKQTERSQFLFALDRDGELTEIDIDILSPGFFIGAFRMVKSDGAILFTGQIIDSSNKKFVGVFSGKIDPKTDEITEVNEQFFDKEFVERFWSEKQTKKSSKKKAKGKADDSEGFKGTFKLIDYIATDDGGFVNFYQKYWVQVVTRTTTTNGVTTTTTDYYYHYTDLVPVKTNKDGEIEWVELLPVSQVTVNYDPGTSFLATQKGEDVFVFYNSSNEQDEMLETGQKSEKRKKLKDRVQRNATIAKISNDGKVSYETVIDMREERKVRFDPTSMGIDEKNQRIVMINNIKGKKSNLVLVSY
jgi:hypothetical protein